MNEQDTQDLVGCINYRIKHLTRSYYDRRYNQPENLAQEIERLENLSLRLEQLKKESHVFSNMELDQGTV